MTYGPQDPYPTRPYPQGQAPGYPTGPGYQQGPGYQTGTGYQEGPGYQDYADQRGAQPTPGPYPYAYPYPPRQSTNTLAILALVFAFVFAPAAIVLGACGRRQIRRTGEEGMGLATAGMVIGIVFTVLSLVWIVIMITAFATVVHDVNQQQQQQQNGAALLAAARAYLGR